MGSFCMKFVALMVVMGVSVSCHQNQQPDKATVEAIRFALMAEVSKYLDFESYSNYIVLSKTDCPLCDEFKPNDVPQLLFDTFLKNNTRHSEINQDFGEQFLFVDIEEIRKKVKSDVYHFSWSLFYKNYPGSGGLITISKLALSLEGDNALIFYSIVQNEGSSGHGSMVLMEKVNSKWQFKKDIDGFVN